LSIDRDSSTSLRHRARPSKLDVGRWTLSVLGSPVVWPVTLGADDVDILRPEVKAVSAFLSIDRDSSTSLRHRARPSKLDVGRWTLSVLPVVPLYFLTMMASRLAALATPGAFVFLVGAMAVLGRLGTAEAWSIVLTVLAAFGPSGWLAPGGWRRRAAEALLLPAAVVVTMVPSAVMRQMMVAPLVFLAAWVAWSAAVRRVPVRARASS